MKLESFTIGTVHKKLEPGIFTDDHGIDHPFYMIMLITNDDAGNISVTESVYNAVEVGKRYQFKFNTYSKIDKPVKLRLIDCRLAN